MRSVYQLDRSLDGQSLAWRKSLSTGGSSGKNDKIFNIHAQTA